MDINDLKFRQEADKYGVDFDGRWLYWNLEFSRPLIFLRRFQRRADYILNLIAMAAGVLGGLALIYWFFFNWSSFKNIVEVIFFWHRQSRYLFIFFVSLLADLFVYYRLTEEALSRDKIQILADSPWFKKNKKTLAVDSGLSERSLIVIENAYLLALKYKSPQVSGRHLLWALLDDFRIRNLFIRLDVNLEDFLDKLKRHLVDKGSVAPEIKTAFSNDLKMAFIKAYLVAYEDKRRAIDALDLLFYGASGDRVLEEILFDCGIDEEKLINAVTWFRANDQMKIDHSVFKRMARLKPGNSMNRSYTALATPTLDYYSQDLTLMAKYGYFDICLNRDKELKAIFDAFDSGQTGILLVGPIGVGKRTIIEGLAQLMVKEEVPVVLKDKRLVEIDVARLVGGVSSAEAEDRMLTIINETMRAQNVILFLENIEVITGITSGAAGSLELSQVLANFLSRGNIYCLGTVTSDNYSRFIESHALGNIMTTVGILEPNRNQAIQILETKIGYLENKYKVFFDYNAIAAAVDLSSHYINDKLLPAKAVNILELTAVRVAKAAVDSSRSNFCSREEVATVISDATGIPVSKVSESETVKLLNLEANIHERLIGQDEAVKAVAGSLRRARAELREGKRPIASFLFLGPTGVGKTELAKAVSEIYFGDEDCMIRVDMSEYQLAESVTKMIGDNSGAIGYLTEAVRKKPFSLVLFDEVEKAHPDILNLFLQMMDDGRLTDGQGRTINFTNSIIVATSNAGSLYIEEAVNKGTSQALIKQEIIENQLNKFMRPELINRFDGIIVFRPLSMDDMMAITKLLLEKIRKNLEGKGIGFMVAETGLKVLAQMGYDPKFGARPLRRLLQDKIENEIANLVLSNSLHRRDIVYIDQDANVKVQAAPRL